MTSWLRVYASAFALLATIVLVLPSMAASSINVVDNIENYQSQLAVKSSNINSAKINVDVTALGLQQKSFLDGTYQVLSLPEGEKLVAGQIGEIGEPQMPVLTTMIAIPDQAGVTVTANYESYEIIDDVDVIPVQEAVAEDGSNVDAAFIKNAVAYAKDEFLPSELASAGEPMIMRDVRLVQITVHPVQYNAARRQLKVYNNISVDISYDGEVVNPKISHPRYLTESYLQIYSSFIANWDDYYPTLSGIEVKRGCILMIVPNTTSYNWVDDMRDIADWKRKKGYDVFLATSYDVDSTDGEPTKTQVKTYIQNAYDTWDVPPDYIYLVGDEDKVIPEYGYSGYVSDHPYSMLDGSDYLPDAIVARVSVDNLSELRCWIAKDLLYEANPDVETDPEYWRRAIMVAGGQQTVTCVWTVQWAGERLEQRGFVQIDTVFDRGSEPADSRITTPITNGVGYVNYRGWAGSTGWYDPSYDISALNQCQNINKPGIMTSIVCGTGDFGDSYTDPCFGEAWIRMGSASAPRGGPSFFGCTDHNTHTQWNNPISFGLYGGFLNNDLYHFGQAVIAGKLRQNACYPRNSSTIRQYFHTYNMLGDPELEMRLTTPVVLQVEHLAAIDLGVNSLEVQVSDTSGSPIENTYVTLIMGGTDNEIFFDLAKTDEFGYAVLSVPTDTTGDFNLTVSGRDLKPYQGTVTVSQPDQSVGVLSYETNDDMDGYSRGNADGLLNPGETIELTVALKNYGLSSTANNVIAVLSSTDESKAIVNNSQIAYGDIEAGQTSNDSSAFVFTILPEVVNNDNLVFRLEVSADNIDEPWVSFINLSAAAALLQVSEIVIGGNGQLDPGETAQLTITLENAGQSVAEGLVGTLYSTDGFIQVTNASISFGAIGIDETGSNSSPFNVTVNAATFQGHNAPFVLELSSTDGALYTTAFNLTVGTLSSDDPIGPDGYGYYMFDNTDTAYTEYPTYNWVSIRNLGTDKNLSDDDREIVDLPFDFVYYGETHNRITICSNGWICMDSTQWVGFANFPLPDPANAQGMIAPFWDDLGPSGANDVYVYYDTTNYKYVIEWYDVAPRWNSSVDETFQIVLYDPAYYPTITGDGVIEFIYNEIDDGDDASGENYSTVGWEDYSETVGYTITYCGYLSTGCATLVNGRVYRITTNNGFGGTSGSVEVSGGDPADVRIDISSGKWGYTDETGTYAVKDIPPGSVDLTFSKDGWFPTTLTDIAIGANAYTANNNAVLQICPIPANLTASQNLGDHIHLSWTAVSHDDLAGYDIYRSHWENGIYEKLNSSPVTTVSYDDYAFEGDSLYWYYVKAIFEDADYEAVSLASNIALGSADEITGTDDLAELPSDYQLSQNYPNPFNAHTIISFALPADGQVSLDIYNLLGQKVKTLYNGFHAAGYLSVVWDGSDESGEPIASGLYFYRLISGGQQITKRMTLLK